MKNNNAQLLEMPHANSLDIENTSFSGYSACCLLYHIHAGIHVLQNALSLKMRSHPSWVAPFRSM